MLVGTPSVFVRTSGCNLRCKWCDTPYTSWEPEGEERSVDSIVEEVNRYGASHVVITGGEPMIAPGIEELTRHLTQHLTIETAGTVEKNVRCDLMSISPKLANSTPTNGAGPFHSATSPRWAAQHERTRYQPEVLKRLTQLYPCQLKFVIADPADMTEVQAIVSHIGVAKNRVVLMPEGVDPAALAERGRWLSEIAKKTGFRMTPRLHIELWGSRRGV